MAQYNNMIPVISVKPGFDIPKNELKSFVTQLQNKTEQMALRITEEWIDEYKDIISDLLRHHDFLLFDIEEQNPESKFM